MAFKTIFMFSLYFVPFGLIMSNQLNEWTMLLMTVIMGTGFAGIGLSIMHDANHGTFSSKKGINKFFGYTLNMLGGSDVTWRIQHNHLHHTFTNIEGHDEDVSTIPLMRFNPHAKRRAIHRFQHIYVWFFYGLMTFFWITGKDFVQLIRYDKRGLVKQQKSTVSKEMTIMIITKILYYGYILVLPFIFLDVVWWKILIGFFTHHFVGGLVLAAIFQAAHVVEGPEFPKPDKQGNIENQWAIHQICTTANFGTNNRFLTWFVGGLNFQVEHHLFPGICHVHYKKISAIVEKTAQEFNLPYYTNPTFRHALSSHVRLLKHFGRAA